MNRRRYLSVTATTFSVSLAGCSTADDSNSSDETVESSASSDEAERGSKRPSEEEIAADAKQLVDGATIRYPDGLEQSLERAADGRVTFADPEMAFDVSTSDEFAASRDLSVSGPAAWIAPVYEGGYRWTYHVFANERFRDARSEWTGFSIDSNRVGGSERVSWTAIDEVFHTSLPGRQGNTAGVVDSGQVPWSGPGIVIRPDVSIPSVSLSFDYDANAGRIEIAHEGGDTFHAEDVVIRSNSDTASLEVVEPFSGEVTQGDTAACDVSALSGGDMVYVAYQTGTVGRGIGSYTLPEDGN
ncbi:hypothetical protein [Halopiger thermotolerans]